MDNKTFDEQYEKARRLAEATRSTDPHAQSARYNYENGLVVVYLQNGQSFSFAPSNVEELAHGSADELAQVEISPSGDGLHWQALDADIGIITLQQIALEELYARIETAWIEQRDYQLIDQLTEQFPQFKDNLYDFFALLIDEELDQPASPNAMAQSIERTKRWLEAEGFEQSKGPAEKTRQESGGTASQLENPPREPTTNAPIEDADDGDSDLMGMLRDHTGLSSEEITGENKIPDVVMVYFEDHFDYTPVPVVEEILDRFSSKYGLDKNRLRRVASRSKYTERKVAAFRNSSYPPGVPSFIEMIKKSKLPKSVKDYWLDLAERENSDEKI